MVCQGKEAQEVGWLTPEQMARMEHEMAAFLQDIKGVEVLYGDDVLHLVIGSGIFGETR